MSGIYMDLSGQLDQNCYTVGRGAGNEVNLLVCHNTDGPHDSNIPRQSRTDAQAMSDAAAKYLTSNDRTVSVHWVVGAEACGAPLYRIVPETSTAYQCGGNPPAFPSRWINPGDGKVYGGYLLNQNSIGIEVVGNHNETIGPNQQATLKALVTGIAQRYPVLKGQGRIVAHAHLEGDRQDGLNWEALAKEWVRAMNDNTSPGRTVTGAGSTPTIADPFAGVGPGITALLKQNGYVPVAPERYEHDGDGTATMSRTYCTNPATGKNGLAVVSVPFNGAIKKQLPP